MTALQLPLSPRQRTRARGVLRFLMRATTKIIWRVLLPAQLLVLWIQYGGLQTWQ